MDFKRINKILNDDLSTNIKQIQESLNFKENITYINIVTGNALIADDIFNLANNITSSVMANKINEILNRKLKKEESTINKMNNFINDLTNGDATLSDYVDYLKEKYKFGFYSANKVEKIYSYEMKLSNGNISLKEFEELNSLKGMSTEEKNILKNDFLFKNNDSLIKSSLLLSYKNSLHQKLDKGSVLNEFDFKNLLQLEGLHVKQVNRIFKISKAHKLDQKREHLNIIQQNLLENKFQKNAVDLLKEDSIIKTKIKH